MTCLPVINPHDILQKWIIKRVNWLTKMKVQPKNENAENEIGCDLKRTAAKTGQDLGLHEAMVQKTLEKFD